MAVDWFWLVEKVEDFLVWAHRHHTTNLGIPSNLCRESEVGERYELSGGASWAEDLALSVETWVGDSVWLAEMAEDCHAWAHLHHSLGHDKLYS
jgi:hypothetical protein